MTGPRVAVTTAPGRAADRLARLLTGARLTPVGLPCIRIVPAPPERLERLRAAAETADWIVVTSRRAVELVWPDGGMPSGPAVAAVGPRTAAAVRIAGGRPQVIGDGGAAELCTLLAGRLAGAQVVFPHARGADPATARALAAEAAGMVALAAYDTEPTAPGGDPVEAAAFGSPSAVAGWTAGRTLQGVVTAAMGARTAAALAAAGFPADVVPATPSFAELALALADHLHERSPT